MDSKKYLAENVLNERQIVTYRSLSRALKVHANRAKHFLFEFHRNENAKRPQSVHATYLISGTQKPPELPAANNHANDDDEIMPSSPYLPSSMPNQDIMTSSIPIASIILAREEDLEDAKATFQSISTVHVYSLQSTVLQDLNVLTDVAREVVSTHAQDDPLEYGKQWGMIQNHNVKRRNGARPPLPPAAVVKPIPEPTVPAKRPLQKETSSLKEEPKLDDGKSQLSAANTSQSSSKSTGKPAPAKSAKGNIFSSFAKAKPKQKSSTEGESGNPSGADDTVLDDDSEEEAEELFPQSDDKPTSSSRQSRKEREEKLKAMMEDDDADDEEMPDADEEPAREPTPVEEVPAPKPVELKEEVTVQGGRRRGKRQVMKKRTVKDEEGYLITREEPTWESFSEDEPAPPKKKPAINVPKGKGGKAGQGSIMSFFGKK